MRHLGTSNGIAAAHVDDIVSVIKGSIQLWPTLVEIYYLQKGRKGLPQLRVNNPRK